jgi:signal peptidase II
LLGLSARLLPLAASLLLAGSLLAADVATKSWAETDLRRRSRSLLGGNLILRYQTNSGIAFGIFQNSLHPAKRPLLIAYSSAVTVALAAALVVSQLLGRRRSPLLLPGALLLLLAGAAGNLRDRITRGAVIDFIDVALFAGRRWPAFNLADVYLAVGLVLGVTWLVTSHRQRATETD